MSDDVGQPDALAKMREPFAPNQISRLPKPYKADSAKGDCKECGGYHGLPAMHLDYVGHAALTDRLLDADPEWTWKPLALDNAGLPAFDRAQSGQPIGLWIVLTVRGVSRLGYGDAGGKTGGNAIKEIIGDALRNAGMRFGAALDLWHKGDLHGDGREDETRNVAVATDLLSEARTELVKVADSIGWPLPTIEEQYRAWSEGREIHVGSIEDVAAFTAFVRKQRAA